MAVLPCQIAFVCSDHSFSQDTGERIDQFASAREGSSLFDSGELPACFWKVWVSPCLITPAQAVRWALRPACGRAMMHRSPLSPRAVAASSSVPFTPSQGVCANNMSQTMFSPFSSFQRAAGGVDTAVSAANLHEQRCRVQHRYIANCLPTFWRRPCARVVHTSAEQWCTAGGGPGNFSGATAAVAVNQAYQLLLMAKAVALVDVSATRHEEQAS